MILAAPRVSDLHDAAAIFSGFTNTEGILLAFLELTRPDADLSLAGHRAALLRWLNSWGCRIRYAREGEPALFDDGIAAWWARWSGSLPAASMCRLGDDEIDWLAAAYAPLAAIPVTAGRAARTLGPTAAAKTLYALRPEAVMPWDAAIAARLHGGRDAAAFARHLRMGRDWAAAVLAEAGVSERELPAVVGRPGVSLAKVLDEYCYIRITYLHS